MINNTLEYYSWLKQNGVDLCDYGINNFGLDYTHALLALDWFIKINAPVNYIHVLKVTGTGYDFVDEELEKWYTSQLNNEPFDQFIQRSIELAKAYLNSIPDERKTNYIFIFE